MLIPKDEQTPPTNPNERKSTRDIPFHHHLLLYPLRHRWVMEIVPPPNPRAPRAPTRQLVAVETLAAGVAVVDVARAPHCFQISQIFCQPAAYFLPLPSSSHSTNKRNQVVLTLQALARNRFVAPRDPVNEGRIVLVAVMVVVAGPQEED